MSASRYTHLCFLATSSLPLPQCTIAVDDFLVFVGGSDMNEINGTSHVLLNRLYALLIELSVSSLHYLHSKWGMKYLDSPYCGLRLQQTFVEFMLDAAADEVADLLDWPNDEAWNERSHTYDVSRSRRYNP